MPETETYERARGRAEVKYGFFVHAVVYVAVMVLLVVINMLTSPGTIWFIWPLVGWGLAVALHSALVFLFADRDTIVDALTERELRHSQSPPFACLRSLGGGGLPHFACSMCALWTRKPGRGPWETC